MSERPAGDAGEEAPGKTGLSGVDVNVGVDVDAAGTTAFLVR